LIDLDATVAFLRRFDELGNAVWDIDVAESGSGAPPPTESPATVASSL
jgi:hypothetical protein